MLQMGRTPLHLAAGKNAKNKKAATQCGGFFVFLQLQITTPIFLLYSGEPLVFHSLVCQIPVQKSENR